MVSPFRTGMGGLAGFALPSYRHHFDLRVKNQNFVFNLTKNCPKRQF
jgi:hypothetical protein